MDNKVITFPGAPESIEPKPPELNCIEPAVAPEFFVTDLVRVNLFGAFARLILTVPGDPDPGFKGSEIQNIVTVKLVMPTSALPALIEKLGTVLPTGQPITAPT